METQSPRRAQGTAHHATPGYKLGMRFARYTFTCVTVICQTVFDSACIVTSRTTPVKFGWAQRAYSKLPLGSCVVLPPKKAYSSGGKLSWNWSLGAQACSTI